MTSTIETERLILRPLTLAEQVIEQRGFYEIFNDTIMETVYQGKSTALGEITLSLNGLYQEYNTFKEAFREGIYPSYIVTWEDAVRNGYIYIAQDDGAWRSSGEVFFSSKQIDILHRITWETSSLRQYLNGEFLYKTFSAAEIERIVETRISNGFNPRYINSDGLDDTFDKLFLLSVDEVIRYFGDSGQMLYSNPDNFDSIDDKYNPARITYDSSGMARWWWLRSSGNFKGNVAYISATGILYLDGLQAPYWIAGVRPAFWLDL